MEIVGFGLALVVALLVALIGWQRLAIAWRRPTRRGKGPDPGTSER